MLTKFGRYPQRNILLKRESTKEELQFLFSKRMQPAYKKFLMPVDLSVERKLSKNKSTIAQKTIPFQSLLFLHGFRQNANKVKNRLGKLRSMLKNECHTHITFLNGTHPYQEPSKTDSETNLKNPIESQRVWYNPNSDSSIYNGIEEAYAHVLSHIKSRPVYDGIIGFSQGGVLASLIVKRNPELFRYLILISSYTPRCLKYKNIFSTANKYQYPSLHVYGRNDHMVERERSIEFSRCFEDSQTAEHSFGHFAPNEWPLDEIKNFVRTQALKIKPP